MCAGGLPCLSPGESLGGEGRKCSQVGTPVRLEWGMPANVISHYVVHLASGVVAASSVTGSTGPQVNYWYEWTKAVAPALITGLIVLSGFNITFKRNNELKKLEILYKEQLEAVKSIVADVYALRRFLEENGRFQQDYSIFLDGMNKFDVLMTEIITMRIALISPKARYVISLFNDRIAKLRVARVNLDRYMNLSREEQTQEGEGRQSPIALYNITFNNVVSTVYTVADVLYRDIDIPKWNAILPRELEEFDKDYDYYAAQESLRLYNESPKPMVWAGWRNGPKRR